MPNKPGAKLPSENLWCFMCGKFTWNGTQCWNPDCAHVDYYNLQIQEVVNERLRNGEAECR